MDVHAKHVEFVFTAYGVAALLLVVLLVYVLVRARTIRQRLRRLEREGAPRRRRPSAAPVEAKDELPA